MRPLIAENWKMNGLVAQPDVIERIRASATAAPPLADVLICPPATKVRAACWAGLLAIRHRVETRKSPHETRR